MNPPDPASPRPARPPAPSGGIGALIPFDPLRLALAVWRGKSWVAATALLLAGSLGAFGWLKFGTSYGTAVQLIRRELPNSFRAIEVGEAFKPRQLSVATIVSIMRSPSLLARVGSQAKPRISGSALLGSLVITPEKNTDLITVSLQSNRGVSGTAELINLFGQEVVNLTRTLQQQEAAELDQFLRGQLAKANTEFAQINQDILNFSKETGFFSADKEIEAYLRELSEAEARLQTGKLEAETVRFRIAGLERELARQNPALLRLGAARDQLQTLLVRYTEANPLVIEQEAKLTALEHEAAVSTNAVADFQPGANTVANAMFVDLVGLKSQREALARQVKPLEERRDVAQAKLQGLPDKSMRYAQLKARQTSLETTRSLLAGRQREAQLFAEDSPGYYRLFAPATNADVEVHSKSRKTIMVTVVGLVLGAVLSLVGLCVREAMDVRISSPGDIRRVTGAPLLASLGDLAALDERALALWRFRTWSALFRALGDPDRRSLIVGVMSAEPGEGRSTWIRLIAEAAVERDLRTLVITNQAPTPASNLFIQPLADALKDPSQVTQWLEASHAARVVLSCPADWTWGNAERARWIDALAVWRALPRLALLVEMPPASRLEALLLAETLPQFLWLSRSDVTGQDEVKAVIATLRTGESRLAGALGNFIPPVFEKLPDLGRFGLMLALGYGLSQCFPMQAGEPAATNAFLSATGHGPHLAPWQEHLTLGAGDQVNLSIFGRKDLTRADIAIGPDGRISYLQAAGVMARGLTIDELRDQLSHELERYYRNARVIVTPAAFRSKKYFLLGTVVDRGAFALDRPTTIIEAVARARGIATGLLEQNTVEIADLPRAFLVRDGKRMPVDFVKLFQQGDLSQNVQLEPDDYMYFPSSVLNEAYVLGSVHSPGTVGVNAGTTVIGVITTRGGFLESAFRQRVLVVRGSLNKPETFIVNVADVLRGKAPDFALLPKDIVYVSDRPWSRVEDLLDLATKAFITTAVSTWAGGNIGPLITRPLLPSIR